MITEELKRKIAYSIALIQRAEPTALRYRDKGFFVAFSGGKDSQVLLDLVRRSHVLFTAQYNLTTLDPPENVHFIKEHSRCRDNHSRPYFLTNLQIPQDATYTMDALLLQGVERVLKPSCCDFDWSA